MSAKKSSDSKFTEMTAKPKRSPKTPKQAKAPSLQVEAPSENEAEERIWRFRLFVAGQSPKSLLAYSNLKKICEKYLKDQYVIELIDLVKEPALAKQYQIVAVPTLVRQLPEPMKRLIGDLSDHQRTLAGMDLHIA
jgi:circadian clock protein KaiB